MGIGEVGFGDEIRCPSQVPGDTLLSMVALDLDARGRRTRVKSTRH
jgi:hypothetical protein